MRLLGNVLFVIAAIFLMSWVFALQWGNEPGLTNGLLAAIIILLIAILFNLADLAPKNKYSI